MSTNNIVISMATATTIAISLGSLIVGSLCAIGGWFVSAEVGFGGIVLAAYGGSGFYIAADIRNATQRMAFCAIIWSLAGLVFSLCGIFGDVQDYNAIHQFDPRWIIAPMQILNVLSWLYIHHMRTRVPASSAM